MSEYIYKTERGYHVMKKVNGKPVSYGYYPKLSSAEFVRDELKKCNWSKKQLENIRRRMIKWKI